jgi:protein-L-isoaspartate(D-aspartate) O-methyltransferase
MTQDTAAVRRHYAEMITAPLQGADPRIREAFAAIPRENFLGPPPWTIRGGFRPMTTHDPAFLYHDVLVALVADRGVNNGSPGLHVHMLQWLGAQPGDRVLHVGAGRGYYTAILAELVGPTGNVTAVEFDSQLASTAQANLQPWRQVTVINGDGASFPTEMTDRIYVNFALADPADAWLDRLAVGGGLVFPLGAPRPDAEGTERQSSARAAVLKVTRTPDGFAAALESRVGFIFAEGPTAGDAATQGAVYDALGRNDLEAVKSLQRGPGPAGRTWLSTARWSLGLDPPG